MKFSQMYVFIIFDKNTEKIQVNSEKLRSWHFWSSTGSYFLFTRGSSFLSHKF